MNEKEYQHNYYAKNREKLLKRHKEQAKAYRKKVKAGLIIPKQKLVFQEFDEYHQPICPICLDLIFGRPRRTYWKDRIITIDEGCYLYLKSIEAIEDKVEVD